MLRRSVVWLFLASLPAGPPATAASAFVRGDVNADGTIDIADPIASLFWLFQGAPDLPCLDAVDADDGGRIDITDTIWLLRYLFLHGTPPPRPFPACALDPSADSIGCQSFPPCDGNAVPIARLTASSRTGIAPLRVELDGSASSDPDGVVAAWSWDFGDGVTAQDPRTVHTFDRPGSFTVTLTVTDGQGASGVSSLTVVAREPDVPPEPADIAPVLDGTSILSFAELVAFLHAPGDPVQTGMEPGAIVPARAAVVRGRVVDAQGAPLRGVAVSVLGRPELGSTLTRPDGMFDLVVNGGGSITLQYARSGLLPVQRQADVPWNDYRRVPDVALIPLDTRVTAIDLAGPLQVARGNPVTDGDGTRQATLLFPAGTTAEMVLAGDVRQALSHLHVRATEYTVGDLGPAAMPGELPPTSGYTYCVELTVDEAMATGATTVLFNRPIPFYVENFLALPVGIAVPLGGYDRSRGTWIPRQSGRVIAVVGATGGVADLDVDGDGSADAAAALAALSITEDERRQLAALYAGGQSLWRVLIPHFSDLNLPIVPPPDAEQPPEDPKLWKPWDDCCGQSGNSIIEVENQVLGETVAVRGTPFGLHYQSERVPGRVEAYTLEIPLSGPTIPNSLLRIELEISIAGRFTRQSFPRSPNQSTSFTWDGRNAYGQTLQGTQPITVRIGYTYRAAYGSASKFGLAGPAISSSRARMDVTVWRNWQGRIGAWDARGFGLGGWSLSAHHAYDPAEQVIHRGDGGRQSARPLGSTITTYAGNGEGISSQPGDGGPATMTAVAAQGIAAGPDGSLYIAQSLSHRIRKVTPDGVIGTVAGRIDACPEPLGCGDGGPAVDAFLAAPFAIAVASDGSFYFSQAATWRTAAVRRVGPDGIISSFAGIGAVGFGGDGGPATQATLSSVMGLAVGPDQSVYISDSTNGRVRCVTPDGIIATVAGTGAFGYCGDGGLATAAGLSQPAGIAVGRDGAIYVADRGAHRIRQITPDGIIRTIAGTGGIGSGGDGGPAVEATLTHPSAVAVSQDGTLYIIDAQRRVRWLRPGGTINALAGNDFNATIGDGGLARQASLQELFIGLAVGPDGSVFVAQTANNVRVRRVSPPGETFLAGAGGEVLVPSGDGAEAFVFDLTGRHLRTLDGLTGALLHRFTYDAAGRLSAVIDGDANETAVERDDAGSPTAIIGPYGHRTALGANAGGFLDRITSPAGEVVRMSYAPGGLLTTLTTPGGRISTYAYDDLGRLSAATDPSGAVKTLDRAGGGDDVTVTVTSPMGRETSFRAERLENGDVRRTTTDCSGVRSEVLVGADGRVIATDPDGTTRTLVLAPDPRWGMRAPLAASLTVVTPGGLALTTTTESTAELRAPGDILDPRSAVTTVKSNGRAWTAAYDGPGRTITITSPAGRSERVVLDDRGRPVEEQSFDLEPVTYAYDARGRPASIAQGQGPTRRSGLFTYGADGYPRSLTDALGRTTILTHDGAGGLIEEELPGGRTFRFAYDADGNVRGVTPPGRSEHTFSYTLRDDVSVYTPPAAGVGEASVLYAYDADRKPTRIDHPGGGAVELRYEEATCRLQTVDLDGRVRAYGYDGVGRLATLEASQGISQTHAYDGALLTGETWSGAVAGAVTQSFNADAELAAIGIDGAEPVAMLHDEDGLEVQVGALQIERAAASGLISAMSIGTIAETIVRDGFGEATGCTASRGGTVIYSLALSTDALGRIVQKAETVEGITRTWAYAYDPAGRISEVHRDGTLAAAYAHDANGNLLSRIDGGGTLVAAHDAQDRLVSYGSATYGHNPRGERIMKTAGGQTTRYRYEGLGSLIGATLPDGTQIEYLLDAEDRRVGKRVNGVLVQAFLYQDELRPAAELNGASAVVSRFVYATGRNVPDYMIRGGATYRIITDHLGSPRLVVDAATGQVAQRMDHDELGRITLDTNPGFQPFGFAGGLHDRQTGLVHFGAREYDPETGRWTVKDPIGFGGGDGNLYAYAGNDPVNHVDPTGLVFCITTLDCACLRNPCTCGSAALAADRAVRALQKAGNALQRGGQHVANTLTQAASCPATTQTVQAANRALASPNPIVNVLTGQSGPVENKFRIAVQAVMRLRPDLSFVDATAVLRAMAGSAPNMLLRIRQLISSGQLASYLSRYAPRRR